MTEDQLKSDPSSRETELEMGDAEDEEPKLKYQRLGSNAASILRQDQLVKLIPTSRFLV
jgi:hypothetical protein